MDNTLCGIVLILPHKVQYVQLSYLLLTSMLSFLAAIISSTPTNLGLNIITVNTQYTKHSKVVHVVFFFHAGDCLT